MIIDYGFTETQVMIRDLCRQIAAEKIKPVREKYDETGEFPWDIMKIFAESDLFGISIEEAYGGMGGGIMETVIAVEELSKVCAGIALGLAATGLGTYP
ncbi:MAG: acyl-CoA dehydrogenase family protein, partial [Kiritimatiellae bacterium]|nr:acyl-CoA dehydrogenase family protein [Kiritimatiellia bacterium]